MKPVALCRCPGFASLVPDFLSLGHKATKPKLINKFTENYGLNQSQTFFALFYSVSNKE